MNIALTKWLWRLRMDDEGVWKRVLVDKYGVVFGKVLCGTWRSIYRVLCMKWGKVIRWFFGKTFGMEVAR